MPGTMIHLMFAMKINSQGSDQFFLGNIAPDAVNDWKAKEKTHYRKLIDRDKALRKFEKGVTDDFGVGMLLHLYLDYKWDTFMIKKYKEQSGQDWFHSYREELCIACSCFYHKYTWSGDIWSRIDSVPICNYKAVPSATDADLKDFVHRNYIWHDNTVYDITSIFTEDLVNKFLDRVKEEYLEWRTINV